MAPPTEPPESDGENRGDAPCQGPFPLEKLCLGKKDKLGYPVREILLRFSDYAIYRNERGIYVHFSDCPKTEAHQRCRFSTISPELCELRYLTSQMHGSRRFRKTDGKEGESLFDHNLAQAIMLAMEGRTECAKAIVKAALAMAVNRVTNDNMIRYVRFSAIAALAISLVGVIVLALHDAWANYIVAGLFGAFGAVFSIITRVQAFEMKPCQQSNMNDWMAGIRVGIGLMGGFMLFLICNEAVARNLFNPAFVSADMLAGWQGVALVGFLGGFAERLVRTMFKRTAEAVMDTSGTPVQLARKRLADTSPEHGPEPAKPADA